jgi:hypothetical protein
MTLRIEQVSDGHVVIWRLSGRLQSEHLEELKAHIEGITQGNTGLGPSQTR